MLHLSQYMGFTDKSPIYCDTEQATLPAKDFTQQCLIFFHGNLPITRIIETAAVQQNQENRIREKQFGYHSGHSLLPHPAYFLPVQSR